MYVCMVEVYWEEACHTQGRYPLTLQQAKLGSAETELIAIGRLACVQHNKQGQHRAGWGPMGPHVGLHAVQQTSPCLACRGYTCGKSIRVQQEGHDLATGACSYRHSTSSDASIRAQHMSTGARAFRRWRRLPHLHCEILQHPGESKR